MSEAVPAALSGPYDGALGGALTLRPGPRYVRISVEWNYTDPWRAAAGPGAQGSIIHH
jgi:hypothetical protein